MGGEKGEWNTSASLSLVPASPYVRTSLIENWVPWRSSRDIFLIPPPLLTSSPAFCCWGKTAAVQCGPWAAEGPINRVSDWHVHTWTPLWRQGTWQLLKRCPSGGELCQKELIKKKKRSNWWNLRKTESNDPFSLPCVFAEWLLLQNGRLI